MSGILLLITISLFLYVAAWLATKLSQLVPTVQWRVFAKTTIFLVLLAVPFVDEVIGMYQFKALCKANGIESADVSKARGRSVRVSYGERQTISGTILPIKESDERFSDAQTGEVLIQHKNYYAMGGWLMRFTPISMGYSQPLLFGGSTCDVRIEQDIFKSNSITFVYK